MARARQKARSSRRVILDAGVLIGVARRDAAAIDIVTRARQRNAAVVVAPGTLAETLRGHGSHDARINHVLARLDGTPPVTEEIARIAGRLLAKAGLNATIDALLVAEAVAGGEAVIATTDARDIARLADGHGHVVIHVI